MGPQRCMCEERWTVEFSCTKNESTAAASRASCASRRKQTKHAFPSTPFKRRKDHVERRSHHTSEEHFAFGREFSRCGGSGLRSGVVRPYTCAQDFLKSKNMRTPDLYSLLLLVLVARPQFCHCMESTVSVICSRNVSSQRSL